MSDTTTTTTAQLPATPGEGDKGAAPEITETLLTAEGDKTAAEGDKGATPEGDKTTHVDDIDIKTPEGVEVRAEFMTGFKAIAKELGLKAEGAQKLFDLGQKEIETATKGFEDQISGAAKKLREGWASDSRSDKEFGGATLKENMEVAQKAMAQFGTPELKQFLRETGAGDHPEMIRLLYRVGKAIAEDTISGTQKGAPPVKNEEDHLRERYPSMFKD